jgi:hypothetical protein
MMFSGEIENRVKHEAVKINPQNGALGWYGHIKIIKKEWLQKNVLQCHRKEL